MERLVNQTLNAQRRQSGGMNPIKRARVATLLEMTENGLVGIKQLSPFFIKQSPHKACGIAQIHIFIPNHQPQTFAVLESLRQSSDICPHIIE